MEGGSIKAGGSQKLIRLLICFSFVVFAGCQANWHDTHQKFAEPYESGNYLQAADVATDCAEKCVDMDKVLVNLEAGTILRTAGKLPESEKSFAEADRLVGKYEDWATVRITEEAAAALTTVRNINYRGSLTDLVMLNTYRALNFMEMGDMNSARNMLIRAEFVQQDIGTKYAEELRKAQADLDKKKVDSNQGYDAQKSLDAKDDKGLTLEQKLNASNKDLLGLKPYAAYVNPFCDFLQGLYFMACDGDQSDRERALSAFKRAASMEPTNPYLADDVNAAELVANGGRLPPTTYVVFETGCSPYLDQIQVPLPLFLLSNQAPTVVLFFPTIHARNQAIGRLNVSAAGTTYPTAVVSDMDSVVMQEFKNELPTNITRMVIAAATKAAIDAGVKQAMKKSNESAQLAFSLVSAVYQIEMNQADLRTWSTLPKQFQVARLPTPPDHTLSLDCGLGSVPVHIGDSTVSVVYVKSVRAGVPLVVRQFGFNARAATPNKLPDVPDPVAGK